MRAFPTAMNFFLVLISTFPVHTPSYFRSDYSHTCFLYCQEFVPCPNSDLPGTFTIIRSEYSHACFSCIPPGIA